MYFVGPTGSDSTGTGTIGAPFATILGAVNNLKKLSIAPSATITLKLSDGYYAGGVLALIPWPLVIKGNVSIPTNVVINTGLYANEMATVQLEYLTASAPVGAQYGGLLKIGSDFSTTCISGSQIMAYFGGIVRLTSHYACSGSTYAHWDANINGKIMCNAGLNLTITGSPNYSGAFAIAGCMGMIQTQAYGSSRVNIIGGASVTGTKFIVNQNSVIDTAGSDSATYLPGSVAGSQLTGGIYA